MSVLRHFRWFRPALRAPSSVESVCFISKRYTYRSQDEHFEQKEKRHEYRSQAEMFEKKEKEKDPDDDNVPWFSKIFSDPSPVIPFPVRFRKMVFRKYGFIDYFRGEARKRAQEAQTCDPQRHEILGPDLSAAHFVLVYEGGVKLSNYDKWIYHKDKENKELPIQYDPEYILTGIDISSLDLRPEALTNFKSLTKVTHLSIANIAHADDWWLDTISGELPSLRHINISGCPRITYRGISVLYRLEKLESIIAEGLEYDPFLEITFLELERLFPNLKIYGIEHWDEEKNKEEAQFAKAFDTSN